MKQTIHIWKGQSGTMCGLSHYPEKDGFVWLSKMNTPAAIQVNCKKCWENYKARLKMKWTEGKWENWGEANMPDMDAVTKTLHIHEKESGALLATVYDVDGNGKEAEANARRIVQCVNGWDELVEAGNEFIKAFVPFDEDSECSRLYNTLKQALADAETGEPKQLTPEEAHGIAATMPETVKGSKAEQFVRHIEAHLTEGQVVVCKICDKTIDEIYDCQNQEQPEAKCRNCGKLFYCEDDYDTLGSVTGLCCPDCGCEGFEYLSQETANEPEKETKKS
jgi:hypothetical protein